MWSNVSFANEMNKIEDIKINGTSIGDNLLDHFSKLELIQNKKLLEVRSEQNQLFYSSEVKIPFFSLKAIFYYESNERVGMTEKPIYRIIGMSVAQSCDARSWNDEFSEDESIRLLTECIKTSFEKKMARKLSYIVADINFKEFCKSIINENEEDYIDENVCVGYWKGRYNTLIYDMLLEKLVEDMGNRKIIFININCIVQSAVIKFTSYFKIDIFFKIIKNQHA